MWNLSFLEQSEEHSRVSVQDVKMLSDKRDVFGMMGHLLWVRRCSTLIVQSSFRQNILRQRTAAGNPNVSLLIQVGQVGVQKKKSAFL